MREVICINIGQAGIQISSAVWELFCVEHGIEANGKLKLNLVEDDSLAFKTFFSETDIGQYVPRCISIDLEPNVLDEVRKGVYRNLFNEDYLMNGIEDGCSNFARGRFTIGKSYLPKAKDLMRRLVEDCDFLQGFFIIHSLGGGTGSGFSSLLMQSLSIEFTKHLQYQLSIFPSSILNSAIIEPYNSIMNIKECKTFAGITNAFNNDAILNICTKLLDINHPTFNNINRILAHLFSDISVSLRFESSLNSDLSQIGTNLIPYPSIHFITSSHSPMSSGERFDHELLTVDCLTRNLFRPDHQLITCNNDKNIYMACVMQYRGHVSPQDVNRSLAKLKNQKIIKFVDWCPTGFKLGVNFQPPSYIRGSEMALSNKSGTMLINGGIIKIPLDDLSQKFDILFSKRSFIHWFVGEGMEEGEFNEARDETAQILADYEEITEFPEEIKGSKESDNKDDSKEEDSKEKYQRGEEKITLKLMSSRSN